MPLGGIGTLLSFTLAMMNISKFFCFFIVKMVVRLNVRIVKLYLLVKISFKYPASVNASTVLYIVAKEIFPLPFLLIFLFNDSMVK